MIRVPITKDVFKYHPKFIGELTAKQFIFLVAGGAVMIALLFLFGFPTRGRMDLSEYLFKCFIASFLHALPAVPIFLFGFCEPYGMSLWTFIKRCVIPFLTDSPVRKGEDNTVKSQYCIKKKKYSRVARSKIYKPIM